MASSGSTSPENSPIFVREKLADDSQSADPNTPEWLLHTLKEATDGSESDTSSEVEFDVGFRSPAAMGLTMKEYEEELKRLTAENFNLKLKIYFLEERLSKVSGIGDKEEIIKTNIQLKVQCESQSKELERKQELLFEASKAFEKLQHEHKLEIERLVKNNERLQAEQDGKMLGLELEIKALESRIANNSMEDSMVHAECDKQAYELEQRLHDYEDRMVELETECGDQQQTLIMKITGLEAELQQRMERITELVEEMETKDQNLATANYRTRKLEDLLTLKERQEQSQKERLEEKDVLIDSLKSSAAARDTSLAEAESKLAKERGNVQCMQTKLDTLSFHNVRLQEEVDMLESRLKRTSDAFSPRGKSRSSDEETQNRTRGQQQLHRMIEEKEAEHIGQVQALQARLAEVEVELARHSKLEEDYRKACSALKNFIKRSGEDKKDKEKLNEMLQQKDAEVERLRRMLELLEVSGESRPEEKSQDGGPEAAVDRRRKSSSDLEADACCMSDVCERQLATIRSDLERKESLIEKYEEKILACNCGLDEKVGRIMALEGEVEVLKQVLAERTNQGMDPMKEQLEAELKTKKLEIEKLNGELKKRTYNLQELVNTELWDKNRQIEKLEKRLTTMSERNETLNRQMRGLDNSADLPGDVRDLKMELQQSCEERRVLYGRVEARNAAPALEDQCEKLKAELERSEAFRKEAAEVCSLLTSRLEELAGFLDSLLSNRDLLNGIEMKRRQDMKRAVDMSRELSRNLSLSFNRTLEETGWSGCLEESCMPSRDKLISEQSIMISRLREQLQHLNEEIKQRDIELSHCHQDRTSVQQSPGQKDRTATRRSQSAHGDWLSLTASALGEDSNEISRFEKSCQKTLVLSELKKKSASPNHAGEASESEAWSEPDRSVSQARMGHLESSLSFRSVKVSVSSESSEETVSEMPKVPVKRSRSSESELRRLQSRIRILDEVNETLLAQVRSLKSIDNNSSAVMVPASTLVLSLQSETNKLDDTKLSSQGLEQELSTVLQRATVCAAQLIEAESCIKDLERQVADLKQDLALSRNECEAKQQKILDMENRVEEVTLESELKIIEVVKQKEAAENKARDIEAKLKETEDIQKEVELRFGEMEKKIQETKVNKETTVLHVKEAERHVSTAEKMMAEAERMQADVRIKEKDIQTFVDMMRREVEEKIKDAERRIKKAEKDRDELRKRLLEEERNNTEVETRVKSGNRRIECMEEKLRELEETLDQCNVDAQKRIMDVQRRADVRVTDVEKKLEESAAEVERLRQVEKASRDVQGTLKKQLDDAENMARQAKCAADNAKDAEVHETVAKDEGGKSTELMRQLDEARLMASQADLELSRVTNDKLRLEQDLKKAVERENTIASDHLDKEVKYTAAIYKLESQLKELVEHKSEMAARLVEIETTNTNLQRRLATMQGGDMLEGVADPPSDPEYILAPPSLAPNSPLCSLLNEVQLCLPEINGNPYLRQVSDPGEPFVWGVQAINGFVPGRRNSNTSPDLGIESDQGRFSSLEGQQRPGVREVDVNSEQKRLELENAELRRRLSKTKQTLEETLEQLASANQRKKQVELAMCKELHKTHHLLKQTRYNIERPDTMN